MIARLMTTAAVMGAVALAPAERAEADAGDFIGGLAVGVIGSIAVQEANKNRQRQTTTTARQAAPAPAPRIPVTERGAQTQTALNYFGYNAGSVDGQIGPGTRAAIERYQASMGYPVNGRDFPDDQFENLMAAYYWADNGGQQQTGLSGEPLLMAYTTRFSGGAVTAGGAPVLGGQPVLAAGGTAIPPTLGGQPQTQQPLLAAGGTATPPALGGAPALQAQPAPGVTSAPAGSALPNFMATGASQSLASHCSAVSLLTSSNGFTTADKVIDPDAALSEQFCLARTYAIEAGQDLAAAVQGVSADQIATQCAAFGPALSAQVAGLSTKSRDAVLQDVAGFVVNSGLQPADLAGTARICLGVGYRTDDMDVALGTGLILTALGERAYGELMGHHLSQGFGVAKNAEQARPWYEMGLEAAETGVVFAPGQPERVEVIRVAVSGGATAAPEVVPAATGSTAAVPIFSVTE